jgi:hypothetical protein
MRYSRINQTEAANSEKKVRKMCFASAISESKLTDSDSESGTNLKWALAGPASRTGGTGKVASESAGLPVSGRNLN